VTAVFSDGSYDTVVIGGRVVADKGVAAVATALRAGDALAHPDVGAATLLQLVEALEARPPASPDSFLQLPGAGNAALLPRYERRPDGGAAFVLTYVPRSRGPRRGDTVDVEE